jgi:hypothetical protein
VGASCTVIGPTQLPVDCAASNESIRHGGVGTAALIRACLRGRSTGMHRLTPLLAVAGSSLFAKGPVLQHVRLSSPHEPQGPCPRRPLHPSETRHTPSLTAISLLATLTPSPPHPSLHPAFPGGEPASMVRDKRQQPSSMII